MIKPRAGLKPGIFICVRPMISAKEWAESYAGYAYSPVVIEAIQKDAFNHAKACIIALIVKNIDNIIEKEVTKAYDDLIFKSGL